MIGHFVTDAVCISSELNRGRLPLKKQVPLGNFFSSCIYINSFIFLTFIPFLLSTTCKIVYCWPEIKSLRANKSLTKSRLIRISKILKKKKKKESK